MPLEDGVTGTFRDKALLRAPNISREPLEYLVAVGTHLKTPEECDPIDFTWIKCRARHTVAKIQTVYASKNGCEVEIYLDGSKYPHTTMISQLGRSSDNIIVLQAVAVSPVVREPLTPASNSPALPRPTETPDEAVGNPPMDDSKPLSRSSTSSTKPISEISHMVSVAEIKDQHEGVTSTETVDDNIPNPEPEINHEAPISTETEENLNDDQNLSNIPWSPNAKSPASPAQDSVTQVPPMKISTTARNERLRKLLANPSPETLEAELRENVSLLEKFKLPLTEMASFSPGAVQWLQQIESVMARNVNEPTIIGVVGNTGAGKSSVINAILDEERLVPTNCMRACTAVVTELSWNASDDEGSRYRAEVEFIKPEDWEKELRILFSELLDGSGKVCRDASNEDSEAGVSLAKIRAVYPNLTRDDIAKTSAEDLMKFPSVQKVLGTTKIIERSQPHQFYKALQSFVDSREKSKTSDKKLVAEMEYWPLIKVVKLYTKADALSTGAVIVDLPGVQDSNAARSAIAQNYLKTCTGLWVVAPITRAVNDKAAKNLLGESFKRQLKYDGTYSRITFICSKTDDISVTEAFDSLGLETEMSPKWESLDQNLNEQKCLEKLLADLKESKAVYGDVISRTDDQLEVWDNLREDVENGEVVYDPTDVPKKRKTIRSKSSQKKRQKVKSESDSDFNATQSSDDSSSEESNTELNPESKRKPLTAETVEEKIKELRAQKKEARLQRRQLDDNINELKNSVNVLKTAHEEIEAEMSSICIAKRNKYSKDAIQLDFAAGIKELDQENMAEEDENNFDPDEELRDYDKVAESLPVFCVSSRAYQKLSGRFQRDNNVSGFKSIDETQIPQLQAHCKKLTEGSRAVTCHRFLNASNQLVNSLALWASNDGLGANLSDAQIAFGGKFLQTSLSDMKRDLEEGVQGCREEMDEVLAMIIFERFEQVIETAVNAANATAENWGARVNRENRACGGFLWSTYKAICRRNGVYSNNWGTHDFNLQLTEPILKQLATHWERAFVRRLPNVMASFQRHVTSLLETFHAKIEEQAQKTGAGLAGLAMLGQQVLAYGAIFRDLTNQMSLIINDCQRESNRQFIPVIARHLSSAYEFCTKASGPGSFAVMKQHMTRHVDERRNIMFKDSADEVKGYLKDMCDRIKKEMLEKANEVFTLMRRDYMTVIAGAHIAQESSMPEDERVARSEISRIINEAEQSAEWSDKNTDGTGIKEDDIIKDEPMESPDPEDERTRQIKTEEMIIDSVESFGMVNIF